MEKLKVSKPITLLREDLIISILNAINGSGLPYFVIENVLKEIIHEVNLASQKQLETDRALYEKQLNESSSEKDGD